MIKPIQPKERRISAERDHAWALTFTCGMCFFVGGMIGAAITLGVMQ